MTAAETASRGRRLGSLCYEILVILALVIFLYVLPQMVYSGVSHFIPSTTQVRLYLFVLLGIYFVWCWVKAGQTLAMKTWRLRLVDAQTSRPLRPLQALLRYGMGWLCWPTGLALLWSFLDPDDQFLHDRIAGTRILFEPKPKQ